MLQDLSKAGDGEEPVDAVEVFVWMTELRFLLTLIDEQKDKTIAALREAGVETQ